MKPVKPRGQSAVQIYLRVFVVKDLQPHALRDVFRVQRC